LKRICNTTTIETDKSNKRPVAAHITQHYRSATFPFISADYTVKLQFI